ncbi:MAG: GNAT family N-acetyltransferase [Acidisphaera sp.]|nr:GNAT family N-acetyltransferase [Acidisphaera sp.]
MDPASHLRTGRLLLRPVAAHDLADLLPFKADPRAYATILGGVRSAMQTVHELAHDVAFWGARGYGIWTVRRVGDEAFLGITGLMEREDGRGIALRFAFRPEVRGKGYASEAAGAALRFGHDRGLARIVAVAKESNIASRQVLGAIGMRQCAAFPRDGERMLVYESVRPAR